MLAKVNASPLLPQHGPEERIVPCGSMTTRPMCWMRFSIPFQTYLPYDDQVSDWIEGQFREGKSHVALVLQNGQRKTLFFDKLVERDNLTGEATKIIRNEATPKPKPKPVFPCSFTYDPLVFHFPAEWEAQEQICELKDLRKYSMEWNRIEGLISESIPLVTIQSIQRIQNQHLWRRYFLERTCLQAKCGHMNEMELFHGSRNTSPELIYNSEQGFDMRFCKRGKWGVGVYFASRAWYSYHFAHTHKQSGTKQIILARVLTGDAYTCIDGDETLKSPPKKPDSAHSPSRIPFASDYYDSVVGVNGSTRIYTVYNNAKAYPAYLISLQQLPY